MTDSTSISILLNSSKHVQAPCWAKPENNLLIIWAVIWSEQLNTIQTLANPLAKSLVDYVLPVPAGPAGEAPKWLAIALVIVIQQRSVSGVITNLLVAPRYSYPYSIWAVTCLIMVCSPSSIEYLSCCCQAKSWIDSISLAIRFDTISLLWTSAVISATAILW